FFATASTVDGNALEFESIEDPGWRGQFERHGALELLSLSAAPQTITRYDAQMRVAEMINPDRSRRLTSYQPLITLDFDENDADNASPHHDTPRIRVDDGLNRLAEVRELSRM